MKRVMILFLTILLASQALAFEFCKDGIQGENNLRLISVDDMLKENTKEWTWQPLQNIEIEARVQNRNDEAGTYIVEAIFKDGENTVRIAEDSDDLEKEFTIEAEQRKSISLAFEIEEDAQTESLDLYIKFYKKSNEDKECVENSDEKIIIEKIEVCEEEKVDEDELEISNIKDEEDDNENAWEWAPRDEIEISLSLDNKDYSERNFIVELIFLDEDNNEIILADNSNEIIKEKSLNEDESDDFNFNFKLKSDIIEAKYTLYARAYDEDDESICTSLKAESKSKPITIQVKKDERKVIMTKIEGPTNLETSSSAQYTATLTNIGSKDEDKVVAVIYNNKLGIMEKIEISDLKSGEEETVTFNILIPENASIEKHIILFSTEFEYSESQDYYKSSSDERDDIKHSVIISQRTIQEEVPAIIEETIMENETIIKEPSINETGIPTTIMTGNVIGTPARSPNWIILTVLLILAIIGIILFFKKPHGKKATKIEAPQVIRRYTAKLN